VKDGTITVAALGRSQEFAGVEDLASHVAEVLECRGGVLDALEIKCVQELARRNGAARPEAERIARATSFFEPSRPKIDTPLDDRVRDAEAKEAEAEAARLKSNESWRDASRDADTEYRRRVHEAAENPAKLLNADLWAGSRQAHVHAFEADFRAADDSARRARARLNALRLAADRWRYDQEARFFHPDASEPLTLAELRKAKGLEG